MCKRNRKINNNEYRKNNNNSKNNRDAKVRNGDGPNFSLPKILIENNIF